MTDLNTELAKKLSEISSWRIKEQAEGFETVAKACTEFTKAQTALVEKVTEARVMGYEDVTDSLRPLSFPWWTSTHAVWAAALSASTFVASVAAVVIL